jgi:hypothetical protein
MQNYVIKITGESLESFDSFSASKHLLIIKVPHLMAIEAELLVHPMNPMNTVKNLFIPNN